MHSVPPPSKEQVRAYMQLREGDWRPPPPPDEIRRQLGWHGSNAALVFSLAPSLLLAGACTQLATLLVLAWCLRSAGLLRGCE